MHNYCCEEIRLDAQRSSLSPCETPPNCDPRHSSGENDDENWPLDADAEAYFFDDTTAGGVSASAPSAPAHCRFRTASIVNGCMTSIPKALALHHRIRYSLAVAD
jgi:hypothetical protein